MLPATVVQHTDEFSKYPVNERENKVKEHRSGGSVSGAKFVEAAWAEEPRVARNSLGCRVQGVLSLHRLWVNANLRGGRETRAWAEAKSAGGCAGSYLYLRPAVASQGQGRQVSWRAGCGTQ